MQDDRTYTYPEVLATFFPNIKLCEWCHLEPATEDNGECRDCSRLPGHEYEATQPTITYYLDAPTHCRDCSKPVDADSGWCVHCGER